MEITREIAIKVRDTVKVGLVYGLGKPIPGQMCIEAAVCFALGLPHGDDPKCVDPAIRSLKIRLNDSQWSSNEARANGMLKLSLLQLGTKNNFDTKEFVNLLVPLALIMADRVKKYKNVNDAANAAGYAAANAADAAANAAYANAAVYATAAADAANAAGYATYGAANRDGELIFFAIEVEKILIDMRVPGVQWLSLLN